MECYVSFLCQFFSPDLQKQDTPNFKNLQLPFCDQMAHFKARFTSFHFKRLISLRILDCDTEFVFSPHHLHPSSDLV